MNADTPVEAGDRPRDRDQRLLGRVERVLRVAERCAGRSRGRGRRDGRAARRARRGHRPPRVSRGSCRRAPGAGQAEPMTRTSATRKRYGRLGGRSVIQSSTFCALAAGWSSSCAFVPRPPPLKRGGPHPASSGGHRVARVDLRRSSRSRGWSTSTRSTCFGCAEVDHEPDARLQPADVAVLVRLGRPERRGVAVPDRRDLVGVLGRRRPRGRSHWRPTIVSGPATGRRRRRRWRPAGRRSPGSPR